MKQSCSVYVAKKAKYCKEKVTDADGVSALDACPVTCSVGCACQDSTSWFAKKKSKNTCANYVAKKAKYVPLFFFLSRRARTVRTQVLQEQSHGRRGCQRPRSLPGDVRDSLLASFVAIR